MVVQNTNRGTTTDFDGKYQIQAIQGESLTFSYVGYASQNITVGSNAIINVQLLTSGTLEEVVVVAYGTQKREAVTGSVAELKAEALENTHNPNIVQGIVGKLAGVQVINNSGQPGFSPTVRIRGIGSINAASGPLYVIDGVPFTGNVNTINFNDVESLTVLKDASATALYGSRGSNGVIILTTKKGTKNKISVSLDLNTSTVSRATKDYNIITNPGQFYEAAFMTSVNTILHSELTTDPAQAAQIASEFLIIDSQDAGIALGYQIGYNAYDVPNEQLIDPLTGSLNPNANLLWNENWADYLFHNPISTKVFLNVSGGAENVSTYFSLGHEETNAFAIESNFERVTTSFSLDYDIKSDFRMGGNLRYANTVQNVPDQGGIAGAFSWSRSIAPVYPVFGYELDGTPILNNLGNQIYDFGDGTGGTPQTRSYGSFANPYATSLEDVKRRTTNNIFASTYMEVDLFEDFNFRYNLTADLRDFDDVNFDTSIGGDAGTAEGRSQPSAWRNFTVTNQQLLSWNKTYGDHQLEVLVGHEYADTDFVFLEGHKTKFLLPDQTVLDQGVIIQEIENDEYDYTVEGYFGRVNYGFDNRYNLSFNYRRDSSSVFSEDNRLGDFYGGGIGWQISNENFMDNVDWVNFLKLKASIGQVGNDAIQYPDTPIRRNYLAYEDQYTVTNNNGEFGLSLAYQGNKELTWETSTTLNIGLESMFFDNRLELNIDYFRREVKDLLFNTPQPPSSGLPSFPENVGDMENVGYEFTLNTEIIRSNEFQLFLNINGTHYNNEVTKLPREFIDDGVFRLEVGRSRYDYFMREWAGVNPHNGAALFYTDILNEDNEPIGREITENYSEATEYFIDKSPIPELYGGFGTQMNYKNFSLGISFAYQIGGYGRDNTYFGLLQAGPGENLHKDVFEKTWTHNNTEAKLPIVISNDDRTYYGFSSMRMIDNSYLSLQEISLSYRFESALAEKIGLSSMELYANADNVYLWSKRQGYDPRLSLTGNNQDNQFSLVRNISLGLKIAM